MIDIEMWLDVQDWNGKYQISNHGRFKSIGGKYKKRHPNGYITMGAIDSCGYYVVSLRKPGMRNSHLIRLHTLVCEHFHHKPKDGKTYWTNHKDGDKLNNHWSNLEWVTPAENCAHAVRTGLLNIKGNRHPMSKLNESKVREMRELRKQGWLHKDIAAKYGICRRQAGDVVNGINWGWLQ